MTERCSLCCVKGGGIQSFLETKSGGDNGLGDAGLWRYPILLGDKGYISGALQDELLTTESTCLLPTLRSNQTYQYPEAFRKLQVRVRRRIETTIGQLTEQFKVSRVRARTHWGLRTRMSHKLGASLLGAFLNQCLGRPLMKLRDLVLA